MTLMQKTWKQNWSLFFFFNFFQYVWPEFMKGHIKIWNSELREMYANVFFSTKCMQMLFLCLSSASNKIYKILNVKARGHHKYLIENIAHLNHTQQLLEICDRKYSINRKRKYPKYRYVLRSSLFWENPQFAQTTPLSVGILVPIIRPDLNQQKGIARSH